MSEPLPKFDAPPVVETALSIQFARLEGFTSALSGWFWKMYLPKSSIGEGWTKVLETMRLDDQFERFGENEGWGQLALRLSPAGQSQRIQIATSNDERMLQIQDSRLVLNWRKRTGGYPSFDALSNEFWQIWPAFERFVSEAGLGSIEPNQWEVTYVNFIPKGELWQTPRDWPKIIPSLSFPPATGGGVAPDSLSSDWRYTLANTQGRFYVDLKHARTAPTADEVMHLQLTTRGPIDPQASRLLKRDVFDLGHEVIVRSFTSMTSPEAHKHWKRRI